MCSPCSKPSHPATSSPTRSALPRGSLPNRSGSSSRWRSASTFGSSTRIVRGSLWSAWRLGRRAVEPGPSAARCPAESVEIERLLEVPLAQLEIVNRDRLGPRIGGRAVTAEQEVVEVLAPPPGDHPPQPQRVCPQQPVERRPFLPEQLHVEV